MKRIFLYDLSRCEGAGSDDLLCLRSGVGRFLLSEMLKHGTEIWRFSHLLEGRATEVRTSYRYRRGHPSTMRQA